MLLLAFDKIWFLNFVNVNIRRFAGINTATAVTLSWNLCALDKLRYCFLNLKWHLKTIENYNHYCSWYQCYYKRHFYHYFHIVHYCWINWITWTYIHFIFPFDSKSSYGKIKITAVDLSPPRTQTHLENCFQLYEIFCKVVIFESS